MTDWSPGGDEIQSRVAPTCYLCGAGGEILYRRLPDRLFGAGGEWSLRRCPTAECGLVWLDPMPLEDELHKAYRNYYTHSSSAVSTESMIRKVIRVAEDAYVSKHYGYPGSPWKRLFASLIELHPYKRAQTELDIFWQASTASGGRLLDVGCGNGTALKRLAELGWQNVEGLEVDAVAAGEARKEGIRVREGTLASQEYPESTFDVVTMNHVIEHVHDPVGTLRECRRILKTGGALIVITPNLQSLGHTRFGQAWIGLDPPRHLHLFNAPNLTTALLRSGSWIVQALRSSVRPAIAAYVVAHDPAMYVSGKGSAWIMLKAHAFAYREWQLLRRHQFLGEELLLIAEKT